MPNSYIEQTDAGHPTLINVSSLKYLSINDLEALGTDGTYSGSGADARSWTTLAIASRDATAKTVTVTNSGPYDTVRIFRRTPATQIIDFQNGSRLTETDLDTAYQQSLYVAQEVAENAAASTQPAVGIGNIGASHIADNGVNSLCLVNGSVTNEKLAGGITNDKLAGSITNAKLAGGITNAKLAGSIDLTSKVTGTLPTGNGGTGITSTAGQVLEEFLLPCDGIAYASRSGTYTPTEVTASVALTTSYADVAGSSITYTPPTGTKSIVYKFTTSVYATGAGRVHFKLVLGGVTVTDSRQTYEIDDNGGRYTVEWPFIIGDSANAATGRHDLFSDWSSGLIIKVQAREYSGDHDASLHGSTHEDDGTADDIFTRPLIGIKAIG